jgi:hypothetical protein
MEELFAPEGGQMAASGFAVPLANPDDYNAVEIFSEDFNCLLSLVGLAVAVMAFLLLMAFPPFGFLLWASWAIAGVSGVLAWISTVVNCTGILAAKERVRLTASTYYDHVCTFGYYSNQRWSAIAGRYVPTYVRYNC